MSAEGERTEVSSLPSLVVGAFAAVGLALGLVVDPFGATVAFAVDTSEHDTPVGVFVSSDVSDRLFVAKVELERAGGTIYETAKPGNYTLGVRAYPGECTARFAVTHGADCPFPFSTGLEVRRLRGDCESVTVTVEADPT